MVFRLSHFPESESGMKKLVKLNISSMQELRVNIPLKEYRNIPIEEVKELGAIALFGESMATEFV